MNLALLLDDLAKLGIELRVEDGKLRYHAPEGVFSPELRAKVAANRDGLIAVLSGNAPPEPEIARLEPSPAQESIWFIDQLRGPNVAYNIPMILRIRGRLDAAALRGAMDDIVRRHQPLRSRFEQTGEGLRIAILRDMAVPWKEHDLGAFTESEKNRQLREIAGALAGIRFDLAKAPLIVAALVKFSPDEHYLVFNVHHIVVDGWSCAIILDEIAAFYDARVLGKPEPPPLKWRYCDYLEWLVRLRETGAEAADLAFWREKLSGAPLCSTIPPDKTRPPAQGVSGWSVPISIDAETTAKLRAKARETGASANHLFLSATFALVSRLSGAEDLIVGLPLANRPRSELEPIVGMFVNTLPLRLKAAMDMRFAELVAEVRRSSTEAMAHSGVPFERIVAETMSKRDPSMNPLFQIAYNFLPPIRTSLSFGGLRVTSQEFFGEMITSKYDATFYFDEVGDCIEGRIEYSDKLYRRDTALRWANELLALLHAILEKPGASLGELFGIDRTSAFAQCVGPVSNLPDFSLWERLTDVARRSPERIALCEGETRVSFRELVRRAELASAILAEKGVAKGNRVGIFLPRGCDYAAVVLGVARLGAVFVPFDASQPEKRLASMAGAAKLSAIVRREGETCGEGGAAACIEIGPDTWKAEKQAPECARVTSDDPFYMIFTSGSTGMPKGVLVPWRGAKNIVLAMGERLPLENARVSQIASTSFDASVLEFLMSILNGAILVVVPDEKRLDPPALRDWILREKIAIHFSPTPLAEELLDLDWPADSPLEFLLTGGQTLRKRPRPKASFRLINMYGPTETSILVSMCEVAPDEGDAGLPTIGRAIPDTRLAVLYEGLRPVKTGDSGELFVAGAGVALGYFGNDEATKKSFVRLEGDPDGLLWYRTGDIVRLRSDGDLDYVGRLDGQMKLRGFRIEAGEVESALMRAKGVRQAAVRIEGENLVAYVETDADVAAGLRDFLAGLLPGYMIPSRFVALEKLPRTASGKIDLKAVPVAAGGDSAPVVAKAPVKADSVRAGVARAWAEVLKNPSPGINDNFFDLGGHSLMLVKLKERIRAATGRDVEVLDLFRNPTIDRQARFIAGEENDGVAALGVPARNETAGGAVAIIGMAGRFPKAENVEAFWKNLRDGLECTSFFTRDELIAAGVPAELADSPDYVPANGILPDIDKFDAGFFGVPDREAQIMDPQQRLLLEEAWRCFEDAGVDPSAFGGRVGVYVGSSMNAYLIENILPRREIVEGIGGWAVMVANDKDFAATRVSYKLGLRGPSISVNTACSTSLVAVHQAVTALRDGQCEMALAGGSCVRSRQIDGYLYEDGGVLSKDGHCRAFDADATGMVGGSGVALVLLKPLERAVADRDHIHAVIRAVAANNDGSDKIGFTAPGLRGQSEVIRDALARAGVSADSVGYVETHGTGTKLGDSIEVAALAENYARGKRASPLYIGSAKTNVGHLDAAAGAAGLIKAALCLEEKTLVPSLHFKTPNPEIKWPGEAFRVCVETIPFAGRAPLRAAVSSLGIGGTNVHAILEEAPARAGAEAPDDGSPRLFLLSGRDEKSLAVDAGALAEWWELHGGSRVRDVAHTLAFGREHRGTRAAFCASNPDEASKKLREAPAIPAKADSVAFMFTGMGTHKPGMGRALYEHAPVFKATIDECADILAPILGLDIRQLLLAAPGDAFADAKLNEHRIGQPTVFSLEYAIARFWTDLGARPSVLIGHSLGELVGAIVAGVFDPADALRIVAKRGGLMDAQRRGAMLAVNLTESELTSRLPSGLDIATINAADQIVIAGPVEAVDDFARRIEAEGVRCKKLAVTLAAHSSIMDPALPEFENVVSSAKRHPPRGDIAFVSNETGGFVDPETLRDPAYWSRHLRKCVRFADGLAALWSRKGSALLECGPSHTLCNLALRDSRRPDERPVLATLDGDDDLAAEWGRVLESAGALWAAGLPIDLAKLFTLQGEGLRIPMQGRVFRRKRHWLDAVPLSAVGGVPISVSEPEPDEEPVSENVEPASENEELVMSLMRELLGNVRLVRTSDFFLRGGDSLLAVRLAARIVDRTGVRLTRAQVIKARTPENIARLLETDASAAERSVDDRAGCLMRLWKGDESLPPIVLAHAVGGGVFIYRDLLRAMGTKHPVWGLQSPGLWDDEPLPSSLRAQAELYHRSLVGAGLRNPVMLGGSSYGGIAAFELAEIYRENGFECPHVAMFDSPGPGYMPRPFEDDVELHAYLLEAENGLANFAKTVEKLRAADLAGRENILLRGIRESLMPGATMRDVDRLVAVLRCNLDNMREWTAKPSRSRITFFKAEENEGDVLAKNPELAWVPFAGGGIEIIPSPGNHSSMLDAPNANFIANCINRLLSKPFCTS